MNKIRLLLSILILISVSESSRAAAPSLREMAASMLMVGFKGDSITPDNPVVSYLRDTRVGGIILFDVDLTGSRELGSRNITSRRQLASLTRQLRDIAGYPLLIAADQEGGRVQRLKPHYGYSPLPSAREIGAMNCADSTLAVARLMADELAEAGVNVNLAPELDIHCDSCPVIGRLNRAYSDKPETVAFHAGITIDELHRRSIAVAVKHFPGHGSATSDSHYGLTDATSTWNEKELIPFKRMIDSGRADMIMTAHIFNRNIDADLPATLSPATLTGLLREKLGFEGVILTDDIYMQGIIDNYSAPDAVIKAILAGADMLIMGNNITTGFESDRPAKTVDIIVDAVEKGIIPRERIEESYRRISRLASRF